MIIRKILGAALLCLTLLSAPIVHAQMMMPSMGSGETEITVPEELTPDTINALLSKLSDAEVRSVLLEQLNAEAEAQAALQRENQIGLQDFFTQAFVGTWTSLYHATIQLPSLGASQIKAFTNFHEKFGTDGVLRFIGTLLMGFFLGFLAERLVMWITRNWHTAQIGQMQEDTLKGSLRFLGFRLIKQIYGLIAFFAVARSFSLFFLSDDGFLIAGAIVVNIVVMPRILRAILRFVLAPERSEHRIVHATDETAKLMFRHSFGLILVMGITRAVFLFNELNGIPAESSLLGFWFNTAVHAYAVYIPIRVWQGLVDMQMGPEAGSPWEHRMARAFPGFLIGVSVLTWLLVNSLSSFGMFELLKTAPHFKTMLVLSFAPLFDTVIRGIVRQVVPPMTGEGLIAVRAYISTKRSYIRIGRVIVFAFIVRLVAGFWHIDMRNLAEAGVGAQFAGRFIEILMIVAVGYLVWEIVSLWINRKLAAEQTALGVDLNSEELGGGEGGGAGGSRLSTVLPLVLGIAKFSIATVFGLIALGNVGIDITPLLAGAGILGLAIGFGAQKLVADIVSGIFFLVDDAFRTGEYVEVDGSMGAVENISIRSMQLRHHRGPVHTIPYGEIPKITNYSRDWVIMKLRFTVPFDTDPNKVKKIFKKIGNEMIADDMWKDDFLQPFKSQGVFDFDDVGMIIRGKFMAKPGKQFMARKEIYNRVKAEFEAAGIDFARREVRVAIPGLDSTEDLSEEQKIAVTAAASDVAAQQQKAMEEAAQTDAKK